MFTLRQISRPTGQGEVSLSLFTRTYIVGGVLGTNVRWKQHRKWPELVDSTFNRYWSMRPNFGNFGAFCVRFLGAGGGGLGRNLRLICIGDGETRIIIE